MRRKDREVTDPVKIREIITACNCCRLGFRDGGRAYIVPMDFGFAETDGRWTFYFHSAKEGRKIDLLKAQGWASFQPPLKWIPATSWFQAPRPATTPPGINASWAAAR